MPDARSDASAPVRHVVVVGGGIAGLAAAWSLHADGRPRRPAAAGHGAGGHRPGRRQAAGQRPGRGAGRRGRGVAAAAPARGRRPGPGRRPRPGPGGRGDDQRRGLDPRRGCARCPGHRDGRAERPARAGARAACSPARELARVPVDSWLPRTRIGDDVSVGRYVARPAGPGRRRPAGRAAARRGLRRPGRRAVAGGDPARSSRRTPGGSARCSPPPGPAGRAADAGRRTARCSARRAAASGGCRPRSRRLSGADGPHRRHRPRAAPDAGRLAARRSARPGRPRRCSPTRWCWPCPPAPAARLLRAARRRRRRPSWPQIALRVDGRGHAGLPGDGLPVAADRLRLPGAAGGRPVGQGGRPSPRRSGAGTPTRRPAWSSSGPRSAGWARRPCCSATTPSWSTWCWPT